MCSRLGLGVFEAGFGPAIPLYFCMSRALLWVSLTLFSVLSLFFCSGAPCDLHSLLVNQNQRSFTRDPSLVFVWDTGSVLQPSQVPLEDLLHSVFNKLTMDPP